MPRPRSSTRAAGDTSAAVSSLQVALSSLRQQRSQLEERISAVEAALRAFDAPVSGGARRGRPPGSGKAAGREGRGYRTGSLKAYIHRVLDGGGQMRVTDVTNAVLKSGFKTKNKTLAKSVGIALTQMPTVQKVGRGVFKLK